MAEAPSGKRIDADIDRQLAALTPYDAGPEDAYPDRRGGGSLERSGSPRTTCSMFTLSFNEPETLGP